MSKLRVTVQADLDEILAAGLAALQGLNEQVNIPLLPEAVEKELVERGYQAATDLLLKEVPQLPEYVANLPLVRDLKAVIGQYAEITVDVVED